MLGEYKQQQPQQQREQKIFLNIKQGAIVKKTPTGEEKYSFVEGSVENIFRWQRTFRGEAVEYWYIELRDEGGDLYSLGFSYRSNLFKSLILSLASAQDLSRIKIKPYTANGYDKVVVYESDKKLDWACSSLPPVEIVSVGGQQVKDDSKRMGLIVSLVDQIKAKINR